MINRTQLISITTTNRSRLEGIKAKREAIRLKKLRKESELEAERLMQMEISRENVLNYRVKSLKDEDDEACSPPRPTSNYISAFAFTKQTNNKQIASVENISKGIKKTMSLGTENYGDTNFKKKKRENKTKAATTNSRLERNKDRNLKKKKESADDIAMFLRKLG